jgi:hypothetical protein
MKMDKHFQLPDGPGSLGGCKEIIKYLRIRGERTSKCLNDCNERVNSRAPLP